MKTGREYQSAIHLTHMETLNMYHELFFRWIYILKQWYREQPKWENLWHWASKRIQRGRFEYSYPYDVVYRKNISMERATNVFGERNILVKKLAEAC